MNDFHNRLGDALSEEDEAFLRRLDDEPGLFQQLGNTFQGPMKFWTAYAFVLSLVFFGGAIYCFVQLFSAETTRELFLWGTGVWWGMLAVGLIKVWFWMRLNHLVTLREIKRIELMVAKGAAD